MVSGHYDNTSANIQSELYYIQEMNGGERVNLTGDDIDEETAKKEQLYEQIDMFSDNKKKDEESKNEQTEKELQKAMIEIKNKYGKNAILKGMNLQEAGTTRDRNRQIGGHRS